MKPKLFFVGDLRSPFIKQDLQLLSEDCTAEAFDTGKYAFSFRQIINYQFWCLKQWDKIKCADIVWIWFADYPALPIILLSKLFNKKIVMNIGGWEVANYPEINYGNQLKFIRGAVTRWIIKHSDKCIVPSEAYKDITKKIVPDANVFVIPNWIDIKLCSEPLPMKKPSVITAICTHKTDVLKGIPTFYDVARHIKYDFDLLHNIPHESLIEEFKQAKVYCQLSYTESFGMSLLEAMACGCVPVVTDRDALPEIVGDAGIVVPYGNVPATISAVELAMSMDSNLPRMRAMRFNKDRHRRMVMQLIQMMMEKTE